MGAALYCTQSQKNCSLEDQRTGFLKKSGYGVTEKITEIMNALIQNIFF